MTRNELNDRLPEVVGALVDSITAEPRTQHLNRIDLPDRDAIIHATDLLRQLLYPGYFGKRGLTSANLPYRVGELTNELADILYEQVRRCLRYRERIADNAPTDGKCRECDEQAGEVVAAFLARLPAVRQLLATDVQSAFDSDPAAQSTDETIFSYPGLYAISVQRLAHEFYALGVPLLPRIMTEHAHSATGIDIHPGATLGPSFFIDHGTGVVIGETTVIGANVKLYQGVTLGALAPHYGQQLRGEKRHPTIEDDVILYAGATILGGDTVIGKGSVVGGNVFITASIPPHTQVTGEPPRLRLRERRKGRKNDEFGIDFQI